MIGPLFPRFGLLVPGRLTRLEGGWLSRVGHPSGQQPDMNLKDPVFTVNNEVIIRSRFIQRVVCDLPLFFGPLLKLGFWVSVNM